jgi:hypothetical protein
MVRGDLDNRFAGAFVRGGHGDGDGNMEKAPGGGVYSADGSAGPDDAAADGFVHRGWE